MWQSFMPLKIRDYWGVYQKKTCIGVRSEGKNVFCSSFSTLIHGYEIYKYEAKEDIEMKIYHTETQEDYDALMVELESEGVELYDKEKIETSEIPSYFGVYKNRTCIMVEGTTALYNPKDYYELLFPNVQIIKYKAKVDEKMKFTKENVLNLTDKWIESKIISFQDLQNEIKELDDTPEKVAVPKYVAEWIELN